MDFQFTATVVEWRGPAPYHFAEVPVDLCDDLRELARDVTYGWGMIPVVATIGHDDFETSLWPRAGGYMLPLKDRVRAPGGLVPGSPVQVTFSVATRGGRRVD